MQTIQELFDDWVEPDKSIYYLALLLDLMNDDNSTASYHDVMGFVNDNTEFTRTMFDLLERMVAGGILESNEDSQYRWNKSFKKFWLKAGLQD